MNDAPGGDAAGTPLPPCPVCGGEVDPEKKKCTTCGSDYPPKKKGKAKKASEHPPADDEAALKLFEEKLDIQRDMAEALYDSGYRTLDDIAKASGKDLARVKGMGIKAANRLISAIHKEEAATPKPAESGKGRSKDLAQWLSGESGEEALSSWLGDDGSKGKEASKPVNLGATGGSAPAEKMDSLKAWLTGEKDTLSDWLGEPEAQKAEKPAPVEGAPAVDTAAMDKAFAEREKGIAEREAALTKQAAEMEDLRVELETLKGKLRSSAEDGQAVDPVKLMEENAELTKNLQHEVRIRKDMEDEIEKVKKGSVAVIKYMKAQKMKEKDDEVKILKKKLVEEIALRKKIAIALTQKAEENKAIREQLQGKISELPADAQAMKNQELKLIEMQKAVEAREKELKTMEEGLKNRDAIDVQGGAAEGEMQARLAAELREKEQMWAEREEDFKKQIRAMEEELSQLKIEDKLRKDSAQLKGMDSGSANEMLDRRAKELESKEKSILLREKEIERLNDLIKEKDEDMRKMKEPLKYKEEEMMRREQDLMYREKILQAENKKLEALAREGVGSADALEMKRKMEELNQKIKEKEEEVRSKEKYLSAKMEELRLREQGIIETEITSRDEDRALEIKQEKVKTGTSRLDDLMLGGLPFGSNVMLYGDSFSGKEVLVNAFVAEGLKKGVPVIWVITNKMASDIREEMRFIVSGYEEYEKLGLVKYVDTYSRTLGDDTVDPYVVYLNDQTDHAGLLTAVNKAAEELLQQHKYYRLAFRSISTLVSYLDPNTVFRFLTPFNGRRKKERAVSFYTIEKGMHTEQEILMIGSTMDGAIDFKVEQLNTMLAVKGICDVQSRSYVRYESSKQGISIGSFSLDHIR